MVKTSKSLGFAALFIFASAAMHVFAPVVGGLTSEALSLVPAGIVQVPVALGLLRGMRWLAWIGFFVMLGAGIVALGPCRRRHMGARLVVRGDHGCGLACRSHAVGASVVAEAGGDG